MITISRREHSWQALHNKVNCESFSLNSGKSAVQDQKEKKTFGKSAELQLKLTCHLVTVSSSDCARQSSITQLIFIRRPAFMGMVGFVSAALHACLRPTGAQNVVGRNPTRQGAFIKFGRAAPDQVSKSGRAQPKIVNFGRGPRGLNYPDQGA